MFRRLFRIREESESGDREFENVSKIDYFPEGRSAAIHTFDDGKEYIEEGVYKIETGDSVYLEHALAENFERSHTMVTFDVYEAQGVVNAHFDEARGVLELYLG
jgi:hypothetical protein